MAVSLNNLSFPAHANQQSRIRNRIKSSTYAKSVQSEIFIRPKSSGIKLNPGCLEAFYVSKRSRTSPTVGSNPVLFSCDRSLRLLTEPVKSYRFPSAADKRQTSTAGTANKQVVDDVNQVYNLGPGYAIYRNDSQFAIRIDSDDFFSSNKKLERQEATKKNVQDHRDIIISQLQEQIQNLNLIIEEQKINLNLSIIQYEDRLESTRSILIQNYTSEIEDLQKSHEDILEKLEKDFDKRVQRQTWELETQLKKVQEELITTKASFESYRQSLMKETTEKYESEKNQMQEEFDLQLEEKLQKQESDLKWNYDFNMDNLKKNYLSEITQLSTKQKSEVEALHRRFAGSMAVEEKLTQTLQELEKKKRDHQKLQAEFDNLHRVNAKMERELVVALNNNDNLKSEVQEFSNMFDERVKGVDDDYKMKVDSLQNKIVEMRRAYMTKCEELVEAKKQSDVELRGRVETAKDVMIELIHTRQRAGIGLISLDSEVEIDDLISNSRLSAGTPTSGDPHFQHFSTCLSRPVSAPTTEQDERFAKQQSYMINMNQ